MTIKQASDRVNAYLECVKCDVYGACHICDYMKIIDKFELDEALETLAKSAKAWGKVKEEIVNINLNDYGDNLYQFQAKCCDIIDKHLKGVEE